MQPTPTIGQRIRTVRGELSQKAFGARVGLSQTAVTALENDQSEPRMGTFSRIVEAFNIAPDWLRTGAGAMRQRQQPNPVTEAPPAGPLVAPVVLPEMVEKLLDRLTEQAREHREELALTKKDARVMFNEQTKYLQYNISVMKQSAASDAAHIAELKYEIHGLRLTAGQRLPTPEEQAYFDKQAAAQALSKNKPAGFKNYDNQPVSLYRAA